MSTGSPTATGRGTRSKTAVTFSLRKLPLHPQRVSNSQFFLNPPATILRLGTHHPRPEEAPPMVTRAERTPFAVWWWTVDRLLLAALIALMLGGIVLSLAASPPVAARLGLDPFYFVTRHIQYLVPAIAVLLGTSF